MIKQFFNERVKYHTTNPLLGIVGGIKLARQMAIYECMEKFGKEDTIAALETLEYKEDTDYPIGGGLAPKRNKQVDVPTEAWQKSVERRLENADKINGDATLALYDIVHALDKRIGRMEENHISLVAYLSSFHSLDINEWNDWKNNTRMLPDKVYYNEHGLIEDCRHTDTRMWNTEADFWNAEYKDLKTGA